MIIKLNSFHASCVISLIESAAGRLVGVGEWENKSAPGVSLLLRPTSPFPSFPHLPHMCGQHPPPHTSSVQHSPHLSICTAIGWSDDPPPSYGRCLLSSSPTIASLLLLLHVFLRSSHPTTSNAFVVEIFLTQNISKLVLALSPACVSPLCAPCSLANDRVSD